ncbi:hypothetical protein B0H19DRAFT_1100009 [Mycena capillaripes]|nr:hypothetical protein B0H19DRAFT_1100009 [Mycena capillaripes]
MASLCTVSLSVFVLFAKGIGELECKSPRKWSARRETKVKEGVRTCVGLGKRNSETKVEQSMKGVCFSAKNIRKQIWWALWGAGGKKQVI